MSACVMGWYGRANCGDDAFVDAFSELFPRASFRFYEPSSGLLALRQGERLILGGGDVVKDYYLRRIEPSEPLWLVGCGLGYESEAEKLLQFNVKGAVLRNPSDARILSELGVRAVYAPDICFAIKPIDVPQRQNGARKKLGVVLSGHPASGIEQPSIREASYFEYFQWELASTLDELAEYFEIHWISFSADPDAWDESPNYAVRRKMSKRGGQTFWRYHASEPMRQMRLVASMDVVFTMKFHGAIFATMCGVPFVSIGLTRKLEEYCKQSDIEGVLVPPYAFTKRAALQALKCAEQPEMPHLLRTLAARNCGLVRAAVTDVGLAAEL
ncbi:MAG: polysaccharide pyruvyl transferase family protein [Phreatobacter sp.]